MSRQQQIENLKKDWAENPRWKNVKRGYSAEDVVRLRGSLQVEYTLAKRGAETLWAKVNGGAKKGYVNAFGAITAGQAMQQAKAGLEAVYLSGWQVAADGNTSETMYPDQSLYAYDSVPTMVRRINNTFKRADEIQWSRGINPGAPATCYFCHVAARKPGSERAAAFDLLPALIRGAGGELRSPAGRVKKCGTRVAGAGAAGSHAKEPARFAGRRDGDTLSWPARWDAPPVPRPRPPPALPAGARPRRHRFKPVGRIRAACSPSAQVMERPPGPGLSRAPFARREAAGHAVIQSSVLTWQRHWREALADQAELTARGNVQISQAGLPAVYHT